MKLSYKRLIMLRNDSEVYKKDPEIFETIVEKFESILKRMTVKESIELIGLCYDFYEAIIYGIENLNKRE